MKTFYFFSILFAVLYFSPLVAQSVTRVTDPNITAPGGGEVGISYLYRASVSGLPSNSTITAWQWDVDYLGDAGSVNGQNNLPSDAITLKYTYTVSSSSTTSQVNIIWSDQYTPANAGVEATVLYKQANDTTTYKVSAIFLPYRIKGVCTPIITGSASVQQCCQNPITYAVSNPCDADDFIWAVPSTWTIQSGQNTPSIVVIPPFANTAPTNQISCRVFRRASPVQPNKFNATYVTRFLPTVDVAVSPNQTLNLCPGQQFTYSVPPTCNATNYAWTVPSGWTIQSGQGTRSISTLVTATAQTGNVSLTVQHGSTLSTCVATDAQPVDVITAAPVPFLVQNNTDEFGYLYYHCNNWRFCANNSKNYMTGKVYPETQFITWQISAPWRFVRPNGTTTRTITFNNNYTQITNIISPAIGCDNNGAGTNGGGTITVTVGNCVNSVQTTRTFLRESSTYCQGNASCYPANCACCTEPCDGAGPLRPAQEIQNEENIADEWIMEEHSDEQNNFNQSATTELTTDEVIQIWANDLIEIYPNPNTGIFYINAKETIEAIRIFDIQGRLIYEHNNPSNQIEINLNQQPSGIYWVQSIAKGSTNTNKVVLAR